MNTYCHTGQNNMYYPSHPLTNNAQIPVQRYLVHKTMSDLAPDRFTSLTNWTVLEQAS